jgi:CheY-like chemotaxis protein
MLLKTNNLKTINCLLVEDDRDDQQFFLEALHDISDVSDCRCVENGKQALVALREGFKPDVIFTDYNMPEMNGQELINIIKHDPQLQQIPVYVFTSETTCNIVALLRASGADGIYSKSTVRGLQKVIHHCISNLNRQTIS